jgi:hypothetical protein
MKKYLMVIEGPRPDSRRILSAKLWTRTEVERNMREAIGFHVDGLREEVEPVPEPHTYSAYFELPV